MPKCWIHGETAKKPTKPLKTAPSHPDIGIQESLNILLTPKEEPFLKPNIYREYWELEEKLKAKFKIEWENSNKNLLQDLRKKENKISDLKNQINEIQSIGDAEVWKLKKDLQILLNKIELLEL